MIFATNFVYIAIVYCLTSQPFELFRFSFYVTLMFLLSFTSQGLGLISGSATNVKFTMILGSFLMCPFYLFSNFFILAKDTSSIWHWLFDCSYISHAFKGSIQAIFGYNRTKMNCSKDACRYTIPSKFIASLGFEEYSETSYLVKFLIFIIAFRIIAFILMSIKLKFR